MVLNGKIDDNLIGKKGLHVNGHDPERLAVNVLYTKVIPGSQYII